MDTSHLAQHAGTAGTLFASVFVVATTTMRTMIPLRVFAILTNIILIATAIPMHNYLVILLQALVLLRQRPPPELAGLEPREMLLWAVSNWKPARMQGLTTVPAPA